MKRLIAPAALSLLFTACDGATGPGNTGNVAVKFGTGTASHVSSNYVVPADLSISFDELTLTGTNGTLVIQDIRFIVEELELRSSDENALCDDDGDELDDDDEENENGDDEGEGEDECEFEGGPFIVDLPLDGVATITTENIPAGTYDSFEFEIDNLDLDDDDDDGERARASGLLAALRSTYPNFPSGASMVVSGTQNGQPFTVYFKSEVEVSQAISPPLVVPGDQVLTVNLNPSAWFKNGNQVLDLLALNGRLVELGDRFKHGISGTHRGDDD